MQVAGMPAEALAKAGCRLQVAGCRLQVGIPAEACASAKASATRGWRRQAVTERSRSAVTERSHSVEGY